MDKKKNPGIPGFFFLDHGLIYLCANQLTHNKMKKTILGFFLPAIVIMFASCSSSDITGSKKVKLEASIDSVSYALGVNVASWAKPNGLTELNMDAFVYGFVSVLNDEDLKITNEEAQPIIQAYMMKAAELKGVENLEKGLKFLEENGKKAGIITTESGLQYEVMKEGTGPQPADTSMVTVHYHGTLIDGSVFDSSVDRGEPATFPLNGVISGWTEGLQYMKVGAKYKFYIPSELAYGANPRPGGPIGPNEVLIFEVELLGIEQ